jgi:hypothetical protein
MTKPLFQSLAEKQAFLVVHAIPSHEIITEVETPLSCREEECLLLATRVRLLYLLEEEYWLILAECQENENKQHFSTEKDKQEFLKENTEKKVTTKIHQALPCHSSYCLQPGEAIFLRYNLADQYWETIAICQRCGEYFAKTYC